LVLPIPACLRPADRQAVYITEKINEQVLSFSYFSSHSGGNYTFHAKRSPLSRDRTRASLIFGISLLDDKDIPSRRSFKFSYGFFPGILRA
jgi:hypothetical protein